MLVLAIRTVNMAGFLFRNHAFGITGCGKILVMVAVVFVRSGVVVIVVIAVPLVSVSGSFLVSMAGLRFSVTRQMRALRTVNVSDRIDLLNAEMPDFVHCILR